MLKKEDLAYSPYEYLIHFPPEKRKGLGVITEQQMIFVGQTDEKDERIHYDFVNDVQETIMPSIPVYYYEEGVPSFIYIFIDKNGVVLENPTDGKVNELQVAFLIVFLEEISKYNRNFEDKKVPISIRIRDKQFLNIYDIQTVKEEIMACFLERIRDGIVCEEEKFIGKLVPEEDVLGGYGI